MTIKFNRIALLLTISLVFTLLYQSGSVNAEEIENPNEDLSKDKYDQLINDDILDESITYDEWVEMNNEFSFDEFDDEITESDDVTTLASGPELKKGDILISNGTSSKGLTGHAGIAISKNKVLHIAGPGKKVQVVSVSTWQKTYGIVKGQADGKTKTKVYRPKSTKNAKKAADWAEKNYKGKNYKYGTGRKLSDKNPTYCSKIVWQAYDSVNAVDKPKNTIVMPYELPGLYKGKLTKAGIL